MMSEQVGFGIYRNTEHFKRSRFPPEHVLLEDGALNMRPLLAGSLSIGTDNSVLSCRIIHLISILPWWFYLLQKKH